MEPTTYEVQELRIKFFQKLEEEHGTTKGVFHSADIMRITKNDEWLKRFLISHDLDVKDALTMLWDTCEWRKDNKVNDISENTVNLDYLEEGSLFVHNRDRDGKSLLIFKCKKHVKGQKNFEELKRMVIYWFERIERKDKGDQITVFFDMTESGLSNLDMEYTKYLIGLFKSYYPHFLNYILIFEMPWVLNAAFKVIKNWMPTKAVQKIKFVTRNNLSEYVAPDQALKCWGGNDDYVFRFVPEHTEMHNGRLEDNKKKVHFADGSPLVEAAPSFGDAKHEDSPNSSLKLKICPSEAVMFTQDGTDLAGLITLINISEHLLTYKIKTTSPGKFRVRPSCGLLTSNCVATINVVLQPELQPASILREKFLIMSCVLEDDFSSVHDLAEAWKHVDSKIVEHHRLKCTLSGEGNSASANGNVFSSNIQQANEIDKQINQLVYNVRTLNQSSSEMQASLRRSQNLHLINLALVVLIAVMLIYVLKTVGLQDNNSLCYQPIPMPTNDKQEL